MSHFCQTIHKTVYFVPRNKSLGNKVFEHFVKIFSRKFWPDNFNEQYPHELNVGFICASEMYNNELINNLQLGFKNYILCLKSGVVKVVQKSLLFTKLLRM
jgi:hypothetical protein